MDDKFKFVIKKHKVEKLLAKYLNDPTDYNWNETALKNKLQKLWVSFNINLFLLLVLNVKIKTNKSRL